MATSVLDLLTALGARLDDLEATTLVPGSMPRVRQEWRGLARASLRLLQARPGHTNDGARRLELLLGTMAATSDERPLPAPGTGLMTIAITIGCAADVLRLPTVTGPATRQQVGDAVSANLEAALVRAAGWSQRGFQALRGPSEPQLLRLAGVGPVPLKPFALHAWRIIGPTDPGLDGAVSRWETAATEALANPRAVTQHALQLTCADIALLCAAASAVTDRAGQARGTSNGSDTAALTTAGRSWRQAARWPSHLRLGGRSTQLRHASADLRQCLDDALLTGSDWKPREELFAETSPEQHLAVLHSGLQAAIRVGRHVATAMDQLTRGASRVWLDARHVPMPRHSVRMALEDRRYDWLPDPASFHSAESLHRNATDALNMLVKATPLIIETLAIQPPQPDKPGDDEGPWETVPLPPLDPLRAAQERANLATVAPTSTLARAIGR